MKKHNGGHIYPKQNDRTADNEWLFVEKPTHLAAQRRHIPAELLQEPYQLIPMASLGHTITGQPAILIIFCSFNTRK